MKTPEEIAKDIRFQVSSGGSLEYFVEQAILAERKVLEDANREYNLRLMERDSAIKEVVKLRKVLEEKDQRIKELEVSVIGIQQGGRNIQESMLAKLNSQSQAIEKVREILQGARDNQYLRKKRGEDHFAQKVILRDAVLNALTALEEFRRGK
jgi:hypothetical protein